MARKYSRDNRGRFASGGGGATSRGGRLATASGGKRKTQVMSKPAGTSAPSGTIAKGGNGVRGSVARSMAAVSSGSSRSTKVTGTPKAAAKAPAKAAAAKGSVADRKKALVRKVSDAALSGKKVSPAVRGYVKAQQSEKLRMEKTGKGSKAARRMAAAASKTASKPNAKDALGRVGRRLRNDGKR